MKNYNHQIATKLGSRFKNIFILVSVLVISHSHGNAQITKTFTKEIEVDENITLESNVPSSMDLHIHGTMSSSNTKNSYSIAGKNNDVRLNISKELEIKTWDQNIVRQETVVSVKAETEQKAQDFLDELELNLRMGADHRVVIDCNLNMELFKMKNGFFKSDDCTITLENGRTFSLEYLALETKLSIPKYSNLQLTGHQHCTVRLGELEGDLGLELKYAEVYASNVRNLRASLRSCYTVIFNEVETANINIIHFVH